MTSNTQGIFWLSINICCRQLLVTDNYLPRLWRLLEKRPRCGDSWLECSTSLSVLPPTSPPQTLSIANIDPAYESDYQLTFQACKKLHSFDDRA